MEVKIDRTQNGYLLKINDETICCYPSIMKAVEVAERMIR